MVEPVKDFSHESCCRAILENLKSLMRFSGAYPGYTIWDREDLLLFAHGDPHPYAQGVYYADLNEKNADATIEKVNNYFKERNLPFWWIFGHKITPPDLADRLKARGFFLAEDMTGMAADLRKINYSSLERKDLKIRVVRNKSELKTYSRIFSIGYEHPLFVGDNWYNTAIRKPLSNLSNNGKLYLGYLDGKPVATSRLHIGGGAVGLYWVTVIPEARGKGIGTQMSLQPLKDGLEAGYQLGVLDSTKMGYPIYKKIGFKDYYKMPVYIWMPKPSTI